MQTRRPVRLPALAAVALAAAVSALGAGCPDELLSSFGAADEDDPRNQPTPRIPGGDDDDASPGDDDSADDDDASGPDFNPCGAIDATAETPPTIDFGGEVGEIVFARPSPGCDTDGTLRTLTTGWVDDALNGITFSASLSTSDWPTVADLDGHTAEASDLPFGLTMSLDLGGEGRYLPPVGVGAVHLAEFTDGEHFGVCLFNHGGVWTHDGSDATVTVPDPIEFVCDETDGP